MVVLLAALLAAGVPPAPEQLPREPPRLYAPDPEYPPEARQREEEADVIVQCIVDAAGRVESAHAVMGEAPFRDAALAAVRSWRYAPHPRSRRFQAVVRFRIPGRPIHQLPAGAVLEQARVLDSSARAEAWREIGDRGPAILREVLDEVRHADPRHRCTAVSALRAMGPAGREAVPALLDLIRREKGATSCYPADALFDVAPDTFAKELRRAVASGDAPGCRALLDGLNIDDDVTSAGLLDALTLDGCREAAADAIDFAKDVRAMPALLGAMASPSAEGRPKVLETVGGLISRADRAALKPWIPRLVKALTAALQDPSADVRREAADSLGGLGLDAVSAIVPLTRALEDPEAQVRAAAAGALGTMGVLARSAGPALLKLRDSLRPGDDPQGMLARAVEYAIAATRADKDDARLQAEDEIRAAIVERVVGDAAAAGRTLRFTLSVPGDIEHKGLRRALARRGVPLPVPGGAPIQLDSVQWLAQDLVAVDVTFGGGMDSSGTTYMVALRDGRWSVVGTRGGWITSGPRAPGRWCTEVPRAASRPGTPPADHALRRVGC